MIRAPYALYFKNKKITVLGAGRTGIATAAFLSSLGCRVLVSESAKKKSAGMRLPKNIFLEFGKHSQRALDADLIIKSPGISFEIPFLKKAAALRIPVWDELDLASRFIDGSKVIAITGTNGKTTTTSLVSAICVEAGLRTITAGNIGTPLSSVIDKAQHADAIVLEISSYQLERQRAFKPHVSAILNITPDHFARHHSMENYRKAKERITLYQNENDYCIINSNDVWCKQIAKSCKGTVLFFSSAGTVRKGAYYDKKGWHCRGIGRSFTIHPRWRLPGRHNIENALAAIAMTAAFGIAPRHIERAMTRFKGVEHRLEPIDNIRGVSYINDSKSTNVDSSVVALRSFDKPVWLILGGRDKGSPYTPLYQLIKRHTAAILLIGEAAPKIKKDLRGSAPIIECRTLAAAVTYGFSHARKGDVVLLSPACASFDQYRNYEERGEHFRKLVKKLVR